MIIINYKSNKMPKLIYFILVTVFCGAIPSVAYAALDPSDREYVKIEYGLSEEEIDEYESMIGVMDIRDFAKMVEDRHRREVAKMFRDSKRGKASFVIEAKTPVIFNKSNVRESELSDSYSAQFNFNTSSGDLESSRLQGYLEKLRILMNRKKGGIIPQNSDCNDVQNRYPDVDEYAREYAVRKFVNTKRYQFVKCLDPTWHNMRDPFADVSVMFPSDISFLKAKYREGARIGTKAWKMYHKKDKLVFPDDIKRVK